MATQDVILQKLANRLRGLRGVHALPRETVAERAGIATETLARIERGERNPSLMVAIGLARAFGLSMDQLLEWGETSQEQSENILIGTQILKRLSEERAELAVKILRVIEQT